MSKKHLKSKEDIAFIYADLVDSTKEYSRTKFLRKKAKNKDKRKINY